jgi:hypothetical protein
MVVHTYNPNTQKAETGGARVGDQPRIHTKALYQKLNETIKCCLVY